MEDSIEYITKIINPPHRRLKGTINKSADHWVRFEFPFWWNDLLAAMDSFSLIGIPSTDKDIKSALDWFIENQQENGLWKVSYSKIHKAPENSKTEEQQLWIPLSICRIFQRYYN
jgi:hypothetical protein